jgi:16S rRNA (cytosine967-C5)-methyltransferase
MWRVLGGSLNKKAMRQHRAPLSLAALPLVDCLSADDVSALFGGDSRHAAEALDDEECALVAAFEGQPVDNDAMPRAVRLEWPEELLADVDAALGPDSDDELAAMQGEAAT